MLWEEEKSEKQKTSTSDVIDLSFRIQCRTLPLDHLHSLSTAIGDALPWLKDEPRGGLHLIHVAESGNGWIRPEDVANELLHLSHRARMTLRLPRTRIDEANALTGMQLDIAGHDLQVGKSTIKELPNYSTLFSRYVIGDADDDEEVFLEYVIGEIRKLNIDLRKILCGKTHVFATPGGPLYTRTVMVAELGPGESLRLQENGIGPGRDRGCGLILPHKGIEAVKKLDDD